MSFPQKENEFTRVLDSENRILARRHDRDRYWRWIRSCRRCRGIIGPIDVLCECCLDEALAQSNSSDGLRLSDYALPVCALFTWTRNNESLIRPLIHGFKGGHASILARALCERLVQLRNPSPGVKTVFLFPRRKDPDSYDHAWLLTMTLVRLFPGSAALALNPDQNAAAQKRLDLADRSRRRFLTLSDEKISLCTSIGARCVFVDDVVTSGSTAMAAYSAAGEPSSFEVWTLAARARDYSITAR
jgi:predicted amidophosphoribosyltransferase